ncbi:MAG: J domain-containing protein [Haloechinothrix sp.]
MNVEEARAVLGLTEADGWEVVRAAYRRLIRAAHPDTAGTRATRRAARLNEAYAVLSRAKRAGSRGTHGTQPSRTRVQPDTRTEPRSPPQVGIAADGPDTVLLAAPPQLALSWLLDAAHRLGSVSYVDRSCGIFEIIVRPDGETCSILVTLDARGHGSEAVLAVESLERPASYSPEPFRDDLIAALG